MASAQSISLERMVRAVEKVRERLLRASQALSSANIPYGVVGGNAVAAWVSTVDEAAVRNTRDVDILVDRATFEAVKTALESVGFVYRHVANIDLFLDGEGASARDAIHIVFSGEMVRDGEPFPNPKISEVVAGPDFSVITLDALVKIKLTAFRDKDRTHLRDLIDVGLIDESWLEKLPDVLQSRLKQILDTPEG